MDDYITRLEDFVIDNQTWDANLGGCRECETLDGHHKEECIVGEVLASRKVKEFFER